MLRLIIGDWTDQYEIVHLCKPRVDCMTVYRVAAEITNVSRNETSQGRSLLAVHSFLQK